MSPTPSRGGHIAGMTSSLGKLAQYLSELRFGTVAQAAEWDSRYSERDGAKWSGRPNGRLIVEVAGLTPGRALDVGCGEGADAIWLARSGWAVTAIDISDVALGRAREAARLAGVAVEWVCGDALQTVFPAGSFALVSLQYPALPKAAGEVAARTLLGSVRPGGLLLAVFHDLDDEHREHMKSRGIDPADYVDADDLAGCSAMNSRSSYFGRAPHRPASRQPAYGPRRHPRPAPLTVLIGHHLRTTPRVRGSPGELLHQCARVQHAPMLDHFAVFEAKLIGRPER